MICDSFLVLCQVYFSTKGVSLDDDTKLPRGLWAAAVAAAYITGAHTCYLVIFYT